jgi:hypothetical protein
VLAFLPDQLLAQIIAQQLASRRERQCELLGAADALGCG